GVTVSRRMPSGGDLASSMLGFMRSKQRSREFWGKAVARAEAGGKTRTQVAKELGVGVPALSCWVYKLRGAPTTTSSCRALVPVRVVGPDPASGSGLSLEVSGMIVCFDERTDVEYVARLAEALRPC